MTEKVRKYLIKPGWGNVKLKVVAETCVQSGKSLFLNCKGRRRANSLFDTPQEAIDDRIKECVEQGLACDKEAAELKDAIKQLKALKKRLK